MAILAGAAISYLENKLVKQGEVVAVDRWAESPIYEVFIYLPDVDMNIWNTTQYLKCRVGNFSYRDYSISFWDPKENTCTLFVDAGHKGAGSKWVTELKEGDRISYLKISQTGHKPTNGKTFCIGDSSSIGHFLALKKLVGRDNIRGLIVNSNYEFRDEVGRFFDGSFDLLECKPKGYDELLNWLDDSNITQPTVYLAGHKAMVFNASRQLRLRTNFKGEVKAIGFWS